MVSIFIMELKVHLKHLHYQLLKDIILLFVVSSTGKFLDSNERKAWGGKGRKTIILDYAFTDGNGGVHSSKITVH